MRRYREGADLRRPFGGGKELPRRGIQYHPPLINILCFTSLVRSKSFSFLMLHTIVPSWIGVCNPLQESDIQAVRKVMERELTMRFLRAMVPLVALIGFLAACDEGLIDIPDEEMSFEVASTNS